MTISAFLAGASMLAACPQGVAASAPPSAVRTVPAPVSAASWLARPGYREAVGDPVAGVALVRVTDPERPIPGLNTVWTAAARHRYASAQAWNADQSLLMLQAGGTPGGGGALFLDGRTYVPLFRAATPGSCEWHPTDPAAMICVGEAGVTLWQPRTGAMRLACATGGHTGLRFGPGKGNPSRDGRYVAVRAADASGREVAFAADLATGATFPDIPLDTLEGENSYVSISPTGGYVFAYQVTPEGDQGHVFTRVGAPVQHWPENHRPGHGDMTIDADGSDVMVGVSKAGPDRLRVIKRRLRDGAVTALTGPGLAQHVSARDILRPGWVFVTYGGSEDELRDRYDPFFREVVAVRLDGSGEVRPLVRTRAAKAGYRAEAQASPSPDGTRVIFASNWDDPGGPIAAYVAEVAW